VNPEDYPDIHKLRILSDVAPYSREYNQVPSSCANQKHSRTRASASDFPIALASGMSCGDVFFWPAHA